MKRILLSVFAAAVTAAWAVPSSAADVTFGGQYRLRGEYRNQADFNKNANDHTDSWGQRVRLTANAKATDDTSVKITLQDTRTWGAAQSAAGGPNLTDDHSSNFTDLHESYVNIDSLFGAPVTLRAGRQELVYGDERLIGAFGWSNNGRSFDALKAIITTDPVNVDVFTSKIDENTTTARDQNFHGVYATVKAIPNNSLDVYVLLLNDGNQSGSIAFNQSPQLGSTTINGTINKSQKLWTYGVRLKGAAVGIDYTAEVPFQTGSVKTTTRSYKLSGRALAAKVGYTLPTPVKVRVGAEYDYASGDKENTDDKIKTFSNLFPTNHDKLGYMDQQAWRNVKAWNLNVSVDPVEKLSIIASYWNFRLAQKQDGWYTASNWNSGSGTWATTAATLRGASATNSKSEVGSEIDLVAKYQYNKAVAAELGLSRFFAGKFIKDRVTTLTGADKQDQDWAYLMLTTNF